jgi:MFS transporter, DHA2 family, multidrug resistance protein
LLYSQVQKQASMLAFLDVFRSLMVIALIVSPAVFLMKPSKSGGGGGGMGH